MSTRELEALFGATDVDDLDALVDARIAALGLVPPRSLLEAAHDETEGDEDDSADDDDEPVDARELLWWLLKMAAHTHRRERALRPEAPALVAAFDALVATRPEADETHAQMVIDATSSLARARAIRARTSGSVLAVGDDDATVLALALLDREARRDAATAPVDTSAADTSAADTSTADTSAADTSVADDANVERAPTLAVADVDAGVLAFLLAAGKSFGVSFDARVADVFDDARPEEWRESFDAAVTDPVRSYDACLAFLDFACACVRPGGLVFLADHPDWNLELPEVLDTCAARGLRLVETLPLVHAYPIDATWIPDPDAKVEELAALGVEVDAVWLRRLVAATRGCTNLYVLARV
ncbi:MAG: bis-aminopropyl spermidine synthase family protein [Myxococcota bacterium]|jgi:hypothetical protein|nr:bis-aminopropyl spermidine synthase family protein [Myxococcota bacterium]